MLCMFLSSHVFAATVYSASESCDEARGPAYGDRYDREEYNCNCAATKASEAASLNCAIIDKTIGKYYQYRCEDSFWGGKVVSFKYFCK